MPAPTPHSSTRERRVATNGIELNVVEAGDGFPVVLAHGFPELSYSWRHQVPALADAGYKVICPDQRGYGKSDRPDAIADYRSEEHTSELQSLMRISYAVFCLKKQQKQQNTTTK